MIITTFSSHWQSEKNTDDEIITGAQHFKSLITLQSTQTSARKVNITVI